MAEAIQRYQAKGQMTGETGEVMKSPELFSASGKLISDIGGALGKINEHFTDALETTQKINATNQAKLLMSDVISRAEQDPNPENILGYAKEFDGIKKQAMSGITLRNAQIGFDNEFSTVQNDGLMKLNQFRRTKIVKNAKLSVDEAGKLRKIDFNNATDSLSQDLAVKSYHNIVDENTAKGVYDPDEGFKLKETWTNGLGIDKFSQDLNNASGNPEQIERVKSSLESGEYEKYSKLDPEKKLSMMGQIDRAINSARIDQERQQKLVVTDNEQKLGTKWKETSIPDIQNMMANKQITPEYGNMIIRFKEEPKIKETKLTDAEIAAITAPIYADFAKLTPGKDKKEVTDDYAKLAQFRYRIFDAYSKGALKEPDFQNMMQLITPKFGNGLDKMIDDNDNIKHSAFGGVISWSSNFLKTKEDREIAQAYISNHLLDAMAKEPQGVPMTAARVNELTRNEIQEYIRTKNPEMIYAPGMTNASANQKDGIKIMSNIPNQTKADASIAIKAPQNLPALKEGQMYYDAARKKAFMITRAIKDKNGAVVDYEVSNPDFGMREDGTKKGNGFLGVLPMKDGRVATEISIGVNIDGKDMLVPSLVPTLTQKEIDYMLAGNKPTEQIIKKAVFHAKRRLAQGKSVFAD